MGAIIDEDVFNIDIEWNLLDIFSVNDAVSLIAGFDPMKFISMDPTFPDSVFCERRVAIIFKAVTNDINARILKANLSYDAEPRYTAGIDNLRHRGLWQSDDVTLISGVGPDKEEYVVNNTPNWNKTTIEKDNIKKWLVNKGINKGFFFPDKTSSGLDYLNPNHSRYAPKLAAAIKAWEAVKDSNGKPPKQLLLKWIRENAASLGLTDDDGRINETGVEEIAKVSNWRPEGGAPKTPARNPPTQ